KPRLFGRNSQQLRVVRQAQQDFPDTVLFQRDHAVLQRLGPQVRQRRFAVHQRLQLTRAYQQFVHTDTPLVAAAATDVAADRAAQAGPAGVQPTPDKSIAAILVDQMIQLAWLRLVALFAGAA